MTEKLTYQELVAKLNQKPLPSLAKDWPRWMAERAEGVHLGFARNYFRVFERPNRTNLKHCPAEVLGEFEIKKRTIHV
jgi:hypothetical protein